MYKKLHLTTRTTLINDFIIIRAKVRYKLKTNACYEQLFVNRKRTSQKL